jgi:hypothetical protein
VNDIKDFNNKVSKAAKSGEVLLLVRDGRSGRVGYVVIPLE